MEPVLDNYPEQFPIEILAESLVQLFGDRIRVGVTPVHIGRSVSLPRLYRIHIIHVEFHLVVKIDPQMSRALCILVLHEHRYPLHKPHREIVDRRKRMSQFMRPHVSLVKHSHREVHRNVVHRSHNLLPLHRPAIVRLRDSPVRHALILFIEYNPDTADRRINAE